MIKTWVVIPWIGGILYQKESHFLANWAGKHPSWIPKVLYKIRVRRK